MADVIFFTKQEEFSDWLENRGEAREVWAGYYKKSTERPSLTWSSSVDVTLCYGWIDGIRKTIDEHSYKIRFTPRKIGSVWSAVNVKKVEALIQLGKMKPAGLRLFNNRTDAQGYSSEHRNVPLAREYEEQVKALKLQHMPFLEVIYAQMPSATNGDKFAPFLFSHWVKVAGWTKGQCGGSSSRPVASISTTWND